MLVFLLRRLLQSIAVLLVMSLLVFVGVYAIGDLAGPPWLAHKASHEGVICVEAIAGKHVHPLDTSNIPGCTYCTPQRLGSFRRRTHFPAPKSFQYSWIMREPDETK